MQSRRFKPLAHQKALPGLRAGKLIRHPETPSQVQLKNYFRHGDFQYETVTFVFAQTAFKESRN